MIVADSTSVNLFKLLVAAARLSERRTLLSEAGNFHTDLHIAERRRRPARPDARHRAARARSRARIGADTNLLLLTHVHYKSGERFDMARITASAQAPPARLTIWDLSHSAGAVPLDLNGAGAELAVGCGYKYLNGGPGAPAFLYVAEHLQERLLSAAARLDGPCRALRLHRRLSRPPPASTASSPAPRRSSAWPRWKAALDAFEGVTMERLWAKSRALFDVFHALMEQRCPELACITPRGPDAARQPHLLPPSHMPSKSARR